MYQLKEAYASLLEQLYDSDNPEAVLDTLEALEEAIEDKAEGYATIIAQFEAEAELHKQEAKKQTEWAKSLESKADFMRSKLFQAMQETGKSKIETPNHKISIRKSGTRPLKWKVDNVEELPSFLLEQKPPTPSITLAKTWMQEHGVEECDWCFLGEAKESLTIK